MGNPSVSVIVPVYKVEQYVKLCVDSILAQTFQDFEIILVDDASPDGSVAKSSCMRQPSATTQSLMRRFAGSTQRNFCAP